MNRKLARSIVEFLRDDFQPTQYHFAKYTDRDWRVTKRWLDTSGLALYFLRKLKANVLENSIRPKILSELEQNAADRQAEVQQRFQEFSRLMQMFRQHGIKFAVEKGFALVPEYCPDISLRFQMDLDFLLESSDIEKCHQLLVNDGYRYIPTIHGERRFKKGDHRTPVMANFYKPKAQYMVELHYDVSGNAIGILNSLSSPICESITLPVLQPVDFFCAHILHLVKHLRSGWVRADALLEYRSLVNSKKDDRRFWQEVAKRCVDPDLQFAVMLTAMLANVTLGTPIIPEIMPLVDSLSPGVCRWIRTYGMEVLTTEHPGSKLCMILDRESQANKPGWLYYIRRLFPLRMPGRISEKGANRDSRRRAAVEESSFLLLLFRYRLREFVRMCYVLPAWRFSEWRSRL